MTPGKGGQEVKGVPVFGTVKEAVLSTACDVSLVVVPPQHVKNAVFEAIDAGVKKIVVYTESVPAHDSVKIFHFAKSHDALVLGPNSAGVLSPGKCNVSDINASFVKPGTVGIVSKSGTLTYEIYDGIGQHGVGISTIVCLGGDFVVGAGYTEILERFERDADTKAVVLLGEIGGRRELEAAAFVKTMHKPIFAYVAGVSAPPYKRFGHAGAVIGSEAETSARKLDELERAGAHPARTVGEVVGLVREWYRR